MILVKPSHKVLTKIGFDGVVSYGDKVLRSIEAAGRTCYKSEDLITVDSAKEFVTNAIEQGDESALEHESISVEIVCDQETIHELTVKHHYSQKEIRHGAGVTFVIPPWLEEDIKPGEYSKDIRLTTERNGWLWLLSMKEAEHTYIKLLKGGWSPQQARSVLPNSLKTEIVMTANIREWRHILRLRTSKAAHPQMQEVMIPILEEFRSKIPVLFDDI